MIHPLRTLCLVPALALLGACSMQESTTKWSPRVEEPLLDIHDAFAFAGTIQLPEVPPEEYPDLHNVFRLSDSVVSGSEPAGEDALRRLAEDGIKTLISVDGKVPDAEGAARLGMRYVHLPIQYKGMSEDELSKLAKTFRELEGPFYVHCFHGRHRGPAAAAVGRLVLDGATRAQTLAEMRQWCGTSAKYDGLFRTLATADIPDETATRALDFDFPSRAPSPGFRDEMVNISRSFENLERLAELDFQVDPEHPDIDPLNEATILRDSYAAAHDTEEVTVAPLDFRDWMEASVEDTAAIVEALDRHLAGESGALEQARVTLDRVANTCNECHRGYRNQ